MTKIAAVLREKVRRQAKNRCGYCQTPQLLSPALLEVEHIFPTSLGGTDEESNLWLACRLCNNYKSDRTHAIDPQTKRRVRLFNPRGQKWKRHFKWETNGTLITGKTVCGRATIACLKLNNELLVSVRGKWVAVSWFPPLN